MYRIHAICLAIVLTLAPLSARAEWRPVTRLTSAQITILGQTARARRDLSAILNDYVPNFAVPPTRRQISVCRVTFGGALECWTEQRFDVCPTEIELQIPGVPTPTRVPVTCVGPNASGDCECDFTAG